MANSPFKKSGGTQVGMGGGGGVSISVIEDLIAEVKHATLVDTATNGHPADIIAYNNAVSGLAATNDQDAIDEVDSDLDTHIADTTNPHAVTLGQVGGTTDHTALSNIGVKTHLQIDSHIADKANPHDYPPASRYTFEDANPGTFVLRQPVWDDIRIVPGAFQFAGVSDPSLAAWQPGGSGATFKLWEFATNDEAFFTIQLPHSYKHGTDILAHIHWTPGDRGVAESGKTVAWKVDATWANMHDPFSPSTTLDLTDTCSGVNDEHEDSSDVNLTGTGKTISSMLVCRIYRDAGDTWSSVVPGQFPMLLEVDFHFQIDTIGSRQREIK